ncbi:efflux RND transporter permease subunit [Ferrimonas balearica]|uniref:efflux RND transporter permease subunit n=1 Tax=Ferrimonas balearica TaxID=44012 RepID=UPI001C99CB31|nr:efflux RND transporter permease subunit [Ferrimonas balearica]MBY5921131.1 efflux RND transporter permease subunit [Ferrimonas balearica]MBY5996184.1 efflux RND transporter permease subunit [Ferrimonas balearica]
MNLATFAIRQRTFVLFFTVLCVVAGVYSYFDLGKLEDPTFTVKSAVVVTLYPGASAEEVEQLVTDKVESRFQEMGNLWKLRSLSQPGISTIFVDLKESVRSEQLPQEWDLLRRKVNDIALELPPQAQISVVMDEFSEVYGMLFAVYSDDLSMAELKTHAKTLQRKLNTVDGIKKVALHGVVEQELNLVIPPERLAASGLTLAGVLNQLNSHNLNVDTSAFDMGSRRVRVAQSGRFESVEEIENLMLKGSLGELSHGLIRLGDIARIEMSEQTPALNLSRYNGHPAIILAVSPAEGVNVVSLGSGLNQVLAQFEASLPLGTEVGVVAFQPDEVEKSINNFVSNLLQSLAIVVGVLLIFMGWRSATIVGVSLLLSILLTLIFMNLAGVDLQRVSLGAFILALGMLVDNAIVITDLVQAKLKQGLARRNAAQEAVAEMGWPLLGATAIAILGTTPTLFSQTDAAEFSLSVVQVIASSLLLSWLVAMTITPLMCWAFLKPAQEAAQEGRFYLGFKRVLQWSVTNPKTTLAGLLPLLALALFALPFIKVNFIPTSDRPMVFLDYWAPNGGRIEQTAEDIEAIERWLAKRPEVTNFASFVGAGAPRFSVTVEPEGLDAAYGQILINTRDFEAIATLTAAGDAWLAESFPNAEPRFRALKLATKDKFSVEARFSGPDPEVLRDLSAQAEAIMSAHPNARYVRNDWRQESPLMVPVLNQEQARLAGVTRFDVARTLQLASDGLTVGQLRNGSDLVPIKLRSTDTDLSQLHDLPVRGLLSPFSVPMGQVVERFDVQGEQSLIWRRDRVRTITAQAGVLDATPAELRNAIAEQIEAIPLPPGYRFEWGGEYYDEKRAVDDILLQTPKALLLMFIVLMAMFSAYRQPFIIFGTVPLALIGVIGGLWLFGKPFGFMAIVGVIALSGMIIKNGIVLMDQIELERRQGKALDLAIVDATLNRTMAISMAALTTSLGMIPLLSDQLFDQMAAAIIGGLCVASLLSLLIMPALYRLLFHEPKILTELEPAHA